MEKKWLWIIVCEPLQRTQCKHASNADDHYERKQLRNGVSVPGNAPYTHFHDVYQQFNIHFFIYSIKTLTFNLCNYAKKPHGLYVTPRRTRFLGRCTGVPKHEGPNMGQNVLPRKIN